MRRPEVPGAGSTGFIRRNSRSGAKRPGRRLPNRKRRASPQQTKQDRRRIKELERELRRKDKALAEAAALLVLRKNLAAIFNRDKGEDE